MGILFLSREKGMKGEKSKEQRAKSTEKKRARKAERARRARRKTLYAFDTFYAFTPYSKAVFEQRVADAYDEPIFRHTKGEVRSITKARKPYGKSYF